MRWETNRPVKGYLDPGEKKMQGNLAHSSTVELKNASLPRGMCPGHQGTRNGEHVASACSVRPRVLSSPSSLHLHPLNSGVSPGN